MGRAGSGKGRVRGRPHRFVLSKARAQHFADTPDMIGQSTDHGWSISVVGMLGLAQFLMRPTEIVSAADQIHPHLQGLKTVSRIATFARQTGKPFTRGASEPFDKHYVKGPCLRASLAVTCGLVLGSPTSSSAPQLVRFYRNSILACR